MKNTSSLPEDSGEVVSPLVPVRILHFSSPSLFIYCKAEEPLMSEPQFSHADDTRHETLSVVKVFSDNESRMPLRIICLAMLSQQISGKIMPKTPDYHVLTFCDQE